VGTATLATFAGVAGQAFLNWDDPDALVRNEALDQPGVVAWAFSTTHMSHYQPLSWLAWSALRRGFGTSAWVHHGASLLGHALVAGLLFLGARAVLRAAVPDGARVRLGAAAAALFFALHPLRVEVVAWASAFPYVLALAWVLLSLLAYLRHTRTGAGVGLGAALAAYAASLLTRPIALGFPVVLLAVDWARRRPVRRAVLEKVPFVLLSLAAAAAESAARAFVPLERIGWGPRLSAALPAPFLYLARAAWPVRLSPLDALPLEPRTSWPAVAAGALLLGGSALLCRRAAATRPWLAVAWVSYLALLAPALGLAPTGLQATADRYTYLPDLAPALVVGAAFAAALGRWPRIVGLSGLAVTLALALASARQLSWWRDSVTLWTRVVALDPRNDVALYNLALAQDEAGDVAGAVARLRETLALLPDHEPARAKLAAIEMRRGEREAARAAEAGRLEEAIVLYTRVLENGEHMRARASRGMALLERGRVAEAVEDLAAARRLGNREAAVASALALGLRELGRGVEARDVLGAALLEHPRDVGLTHNLARLLATSPDPQVRDGTRALSLALEVQEATRGEDPRAYDTLAAAYAATGQLELARDAADRGLALARSGADASLAAALEARARSLPPRKSPGR
jgi:tetratricopeptide (TPR) repeat protein